MSATPPRAAAPLALCFVDDHGRRVAGDHDLLVLHDDAVGAAGLQPLEDLCTGKTDLHEASRRVPEPGDLDDRLAGLLPFRVSCRPSLRDCSISRRSCSSSGCASSIERGGVRSGRRQLRQTPKKSTSQTFGSPRPTR
jgi:hypothetical protein